MEELSKLQEQAMEALRRDVKAILMESAAKKLSPASARDLVSYIKLLAEEVERQDKADASASKMTNEELIEHAKAILKGDPSAAS